MQSPLFPITLMAKPLRYERPEWASGPLIIRQDLTGKLPTEAYYRGWKLRYVEYGYELGDPVILYDQRGAILYEWPYTPSLTQVMEVCELLRGTRQ